MLIDLHVHTNASDGLFPPAKIVKLAKLAGVTVLGVADHDTVNGIDESIEAGVNEGVKIVPSVEINSYNGDAEYHILGCFIDHTDEELRGVLAEFRRARVQRMHVILSRLAALDISLKAEEVLSLSGDGSLGRPHIARALVKKGYASSVRDAFDMYIGEGKPAYAPRSKLTPEEAITIINRAGGVAVLAHPGLWGGDDIIPRLASSGMEGIEVYSPSHTRDQTKRYLKLAHELGLVATGGSDYHGWGNTDRNTIGIARTPPSEFAHLEALAKEKNS